MGLCGDNEGRCGTILRWRDMSQGAGVVGGGPACLAVTGRWHWDQEDWESLV